MPVNNGLRVAAVLPSDSPYRTALIEHVTSRGGQVDEFDENMTWSNDDKIERYSMILVDWRVPYSHSFIETVKVPRRTSRTPVIGIYPSDTDPERFETFTIVPEEEIQDSLPADSLIERADRLLSLQRSRPRHFLQDMVLRFGTTTNEIEKAADLFERLLEELGYAETDQVLMSHSFREAVGNAAEHGNGHNKSKMLRIVYMVDYEKMVIIVTDEGVGFDHVAYIQEKEQETALETTTSRNPNVRPGGLGYHIMKRACDAIRYNKEGNTIFLMKYLPGFRRGDDVAADQDDDGAADQDDDQDDDVADIEE
jgi:anti-sigma regulatory factor (Ser/Thr protein kinase)